MTDEIKEEQSAQSGQPAQSEQTAQSAADGVPAIPDAIFIEEVHGHNARIRKVLEFTHSSTRAAAIMLLAAIAAVAIANSGLYEGFLSFVEVPIGLIVGPWEPTLTLGEVINDILMAFFFLLVGLEIKYEMTVGELTNIRQALLPIVAACGGVLVPILIYTFFNFGNAETAHGWGVPTATDIAFALGIMSLLGDRIPNGIRVFLSTLAVADDIIAIIVIAVFYGHSPDIMWLLAALAVYVVLIVMNRMHVYSIVPYMLIGTVLWFCVYSSGVHSTIAGVLIAFVIPSGSRVNLKRFIKWSGKTIERAEENFDAEEPVIGQSDYLASVSNLSRIAQQVVPPATRMERGLYPWVYFLILPLFALTNADVSLVGMDMGEFFSSPILYGVFFGLLLGKPIGIMLFSFIVVKSGLASLPEHVNWRHMMGASILGGVGFTMAIFVANLAFESSTDVTIAKAAILAASVVAGIVGFTFLLVEAKADAKRGVSYVTVSSDDNITHEDKEAMADLNETLEDLDEESIGELEASIKEKHPKEVKAYRKGYDRNAEPEKKRGRKPGEKRGEKPEVKPEEKPGEKQ